MWSYLDSKKPIAIAHRGSAAHATENSMEAFGHAVSLGFRYLETDVHATNDSVLLAFHDEKIDRITDGKGAIRLSPWQNIRKFRLSNGETIPLLEDILSSWPDIYVNIDAKSDESVGPLIKAIKRNNAVDRICVGSFSDRRLKIIREALGPKLCTSAGPWEVFKLRLASFGMPIGRIQAACAQVPEYHYGIRIIDNWFVKCAHKLDLKLHVWTVNTRSDIERLLDKGVDGIVTDETELLKTIFKERNLW